ncbi:MAG: glycosyl transferase family 1 [Deltaproteobacteria bacterium RBG_19FT_COMBO_46_12]|nr:MAG: glycosyl transferase family 1 [Deltaproteobacteria bacterium RBG_19FT_COMBO_46_12]
MSSAPLLDYEAIVGRPILDELYLLAEMLKGKRVKMINSTAVGGGVAEILNRLVPLLNGLEIETQWDVIKGGEDFFEVTKKIHNALHGEKTSLTPRMKEIFLEVNRENLRNTNLDQDVVVIHDPQAIVYIEMRDRTQAKWVWRCHIDISHPDEEVWEFLKGYVEQYDAALFSSPRFSKRLPIPQFLFFPSIDPLSDKNRELESEFIDEVLERFNIPQDKPIISQISRFDHLKDPIGVIKAYRMAKRYIDCQLVLAGGGASDDPESEVVLDEVRTEAKRDPDIHILLLPPTSSLEINALQRASTLILQKSIREGFGLTVSEALWKKKPVIGSAVGGIPAQIIPNFTGVLVYSIEGTAYQIRYLLSHPDIAKRLGDYGHEYVKREFLITRSLRRYLLLFHVLFHPGERIINL